MSLLRNDHNNHTIDNLTYTYNTLENNRLNKIRDISGDNTGLTSSPTPFSYQYDNIGNLIEDEEGEIRQINWTVYGKVASVTKQDNTEISYKYDATGNRIYKKVSSTSVTTKTHYVRDASSNLMATYENKIAKEFVIYGSSRIGIYNGSTSERKRTLGNKKYELSNHLGNVLSVISDNKIGIDNLGNDFIADYYEPLIISESDYYPFGMMMEKRSSQNQDYLFAFQGQEKNEELGTVHYKYREDDPVTGRFWSVDPLTAEYPHNYPFAFSENRVIDGVELEGLEWTDANKNELIQEQIKNVKVFIFYAPGGAEADGFETQAMERYKYFTEKYGEGSVALSGAETMEQFIKDWENMEGNDIQEVWLNYHGDASTIVLPKDRNNLSSVGNETNETKSPAININTMPFPKGNIFEATLKINSCRAANTSDFPSKKTVAQAFTGRFFTPHHKGFKTIEAATGGVSYWSDGETFAYGSYHTFRNPYYKFYQDEGSAFDYLYNMGMDVR